MGLLLVVLSACITDNEGQNAPEKPTSLPTPDFKLRRVAQEETLALRLAGGLIAQPGNYVEKGQNEVINYAIDQKLDVQSTSRGLLYQVIEPGEGESIEWGDRLQVHYQGYFLDGTTFDSSYERGKPLEFYVGNVIPGWNEGLQKLRVGSKALLLVPAHLAYGVQGLSDGQGGYLVPPKKSLIFQIHVMERIYSEKKDE